MVPTYTTSRLPARSKAKIQQLGIYPTLPSVFGQTFIPSIPICVIRLFVYPFQVSQVVQKAPAQPRAGEVTAGRADRSDGGVAQRRQPGRADNADEKVIVCNHGVRQSGNQHERGGVPGAGPTVGGGRASKVGQRHNHNHAAVPVAAVGRTPAERSADGHRSGSYGGHAGRCRRRGGCCHRH